MACFATAAVDTYYTSTLKEATGVTGAKKVEHFFNVFLVCEVVLNIITTGKPIVTSTRQATTNRDQSHDSIPHPQHLPSLSTLLLQRLREHDCTGQSTSMARV